MHSVRTMRIITACVGALSLTAAAAVAPVTAKPRPPQYYDLDKAPKPKITGKQIVAGLEGFADRFFMRQNGLPNNDAAAEFLAKEARKSGFKSKILSYEAGTPTRDCKVVQSIKKGTKKPNEWIAFIAHFDIVPQTIQGAYDDGSGTNMMRYFAKAFKNVKTNRSLVLLWFDCEENGLLASELYAEELKQKGQKIAAAFGFDMVGIGYPAPFCICIYHGPMPEDAAKAVPIIQYVNFDYLEFPEGDGGAGLEQTWPTGAVLGDGHVCVCGANIRNSDESNFAQRGYFTMRWTGMHDAIDYPGYHMPWDTVPFMELVAGGRDNLEQGTENTFKSAYYTTFVIDNLP